MKMIKPALIVGKYLIKRNIKKNKKNRFVKKFKLNLITIPKHGGKILYHLGRIKARKLILKNMK